MKKKVISMLLILVTVFTSACGINSGCNCKCRCEGCQNYKPYDDATQDIPYTDAEDIFAKVEKEQKETAQNDATSEEASETVPSVEENIIEQQTETIASGENETTQEGETEQERISPFAGLSNEEKESRRQYQRELVEARDFLYTQPASLEKTQKINEYDKLIIKYNSYDFSDSTVQIFGDSITEAVSGRVDADGRRISYTDYMNDSLYIGNMMVDGLAGRSYMNFGKDELAFGDFFRDKIYIFADAVVFFMGINDYLSEADDKRFGVLDYASPSNAGYCGIIRDIAKYYEKNLPDVEVFFVTTYNMTRASNATYTDKNPAPTYGEMMNVIRDTAEVSGAHVIDLYNSGFMDATDPTTGNTYLADGVHPNDAGNRILADHIAAEIAYYFSQNK